MKIFCEYGEHNVDENEIDNNATNFFFGFVICNECMKKIEEERIKNNVK